MIRSGVILIWTGTNATIPANWERETALDGYYLKGTAADVNPGGAGGSNTHSHTSPTHTHSLVHHVHSILNTEDDNGASSDCTSGDGEGVGHHRHLSFSNSTTTTAGLYDAISYASVNQEPPYYSVIFIKPSGTTAPIRQNIVGFFNGVTAPADWSFCDGNGGTPDLRNKYLKGASIGGDAGGTGGTLTHTHVVDHTHTVRSHTHTGTTSTITGNQNSTGSGGICKWHSHPFSLDANSAESGNAYVSSVTSDTVEPAYKKLSPIQMTATTSQGRKGLVAMWLGTLATIPVGWLLCDGINGTLDLRGFYLKCSNLMSENGDTGGANTHVHTASDSHTHEAAWTHRHSGSTDYYQGNGADNVGGDQNVGIHSHQIIEGAMSAATSVWSSTTISGDSTSNEPTYKTVAFIELSFLESGMTQII